MSDMGEMFNAMKRHVKEHKAKMLAQADTAGWTQHTEYHFSRVFGSDRMDWWPSGGKARYKGKMVYGHEKVSALIAKLKSGGSPRK